MVVSLCGCSSDYEVVDRGRMKWMTASWVLEVRRTERFYRRESQYGSILFSRFWKACNRRKHPVVYAPCSDVSPRQNTPDRPVHHINPVIEPQVHCGWSGSSIESKVQSVQSRCLDLSEGARCFPFPGLYSHARGH